MAVEGSATVNTIRKGRVNVVKWEYTTGAANGKLEDVGQITLPYGHILGALFIPDGTDVPDDLYDIMIVMNEGIGGDILQGTGANLPGGANKAYAWVSSLMGAGGVPLFLWNATVTLQSGTVVGTSTDIGHDKSGVIYLYILLPEVYGIL